MEPAALRFPQTRSSQTRRRRIPHDPHRRIHPPVRPVRSCRCHRRRRRDRPRRVRRNRRGGHRYRYDRRRNGFVDGCLDRHLHARSTGDYTDGTYSAEGSYATPESVETIAVTVTLADGVITDVSVEGDPQKPESAQYQGAVHRWHRGRRGGSADRRISKSAESRVPRSPAADSTRRSRPSSPRRRPDGWSPGPSRRSARSGRSTPMSRSATAERGGQ